MLRDARGSARRAPQQLPGEGWSASGTQTAMLRAATSSPAVFQTTRRLGLDEELWASEVVLTAESMQSGLAVGHMYVQTNNMLLAFPCA